MKCVRWLVMRRQTYRRLVTSLSDYDEFCTQYEGASVERLGELDEAELGYLYAIRDAATEAVSARG